MADAGAIRMGRAFVELFADDSKLQKTLRGIQAGASKWGSSLVGVGKDISKVGGIMLAPFLASAKMFADAGSQLNDMSDRTGVAVEALSELQYGAEQSGASMEDLEGGLRKMQNKLADAAGGSKEAQKALNELGLDVQEFGNKTPDEQLALFADKIAEIKDPALKTAYAMDIFGKSGTKLLPMLSGGAKGLKENAAEAKRLGLVWSTQDAKSADALGDAMDKVWATLKGVAYSVGSAVAPMFTVLAEQMATGVAAVSKWMREHKGLIAIAATGSAAILGLGVSLTGVGYALKGFAVVLGPVMSGLKLFGQVGGSVINMAVKLGSVLTTSVVTIGKAMIATIVKSVSAMVSWIASAVSGTAANLSLAASEIAALSPLALLGIALAGVAVALIYVSGVVQKAASTFADAFKAMWGDAKTAMKGIGDALAKGDLEAAMNIAWTGIKLIWARGVNAVLTTWADCTNTFLNMFTIAGGTLAEVWTEVVAGLKTAWVNVIEFIQGAWYAMAATLADPIVNAVVESSKMQDRLKNKFGLMSDATLAEEEKKADLVGDGLKVIAKTRIATGMAKVPLEAKKKRDEIADDKAGELDSIQRETDWKVNTRLDNSATALAERERKIQELQAQLKTLTDKAAEPQKEEQAKRLTGAGIAAKAAANGKDKLESSGTFSAASVRGFGAGSVFDSMSNGIGEVAANTKRLVQKANDGGLVFAE